MGIFHDQVEVINRTSKPLNVRFDGQDLELEPNYDAEGNLLEDVHNMVPRQVVPYARAQNPLMGSEDVIDPSSWESLVSMKVKRGEKQVHDLSYLEQSDVLTRVDINELLSDDMTVKQVITRGKREHRAVDSNVGVATEPFSVKAR